jgi:hypothetical protein
VLKRLSVICVSDKAKLQTVSAKQNCKKIKVHLIENLDKDKKYTMPGRTKNLISLVFCADVRLRLRAPGSRALKRKKLIKKKMQKVTTEKCTTRSLINLLFTK